jgi:transcriptional regulator with XRE-family HTH domain
MPGAGKMTVSEKSVCERLAAMRRFAGLSQEELAGAIGLSRAQLANIETGRTHLDFVAGWNACKRLGLRQLYLADGSLPMTPFHHVDIFDPDMKLPRCSFREGCLTGPFAELLAYADSVASPTGPGHDLNLYERTISGLVRSVLLRTDPRDYPQLQDWIYSALQKFGAPKTKLLTGVTESGKTSVVKSELTLKNLLARLNSATEKPGMKSALAKHIGVPLSNVSQWLSGKREPSGSTTLRLLKWVEQQERSTK